MPASMINEDKGSRPKVIGSSIAMVGIGPMPGSTPISVPNMHPTKQKKMFCSDAAAVKPVIRLWMAFTTQFPHKAGQGLPKAIDECESREDGHSHSEYQGFDQIRLRPGIGGKDRQNDRG